MIYDVVCFFWGGVGGWWRGKTLRILHLRKRLPHKSPVLSLLPLKSASFCVAVVCMMGGIEFYFKCELNSPCV